MKKRNIFLFIILGIVILIVIGFSYIYIKTYLEMKEEKENLYNNSETMYSSNENVVVQDDESAFERTMKTISNMFRTDSKDNDTPTENNEVTPKKLSCDSTKYTKNISKSTEDKIHYINAGPGDAILIESNGHFGLIDATNPSYDDKTPQSIYDKNHFTVDHVISYLKKIFKCDDNCKGHLDFVIATHSHSDHIGGMKNIADEFADGNTTYFYRKYELTSNDFLQNGYYNSSFKTKTYDKKNDWDNEGYYNRSKDAMEKEGACLEEITNMTFDFDFGDFNIRILNTQEAREDEMVCIKGDTKSSKNIQLSNIGKWNNTKCKNNGGNLYAFGENKNSIVELVTYKNSKTLLAADMEVEDELELLKDKDLREDLSNIDVVKFGHHGTSTSSHIEFVKVLQPENGIISRPNLADAPSSFDMLATQQMRYMQMNFKTNIYVLGNVKDAIIQKYSNDGSYTLIDSITKKKPSSASLDFTDKDSNGKWHKLVLDGKEYWYYFKDNETIDVNGWREIDKKWYYFNNNGLARTGWQELNWNKISNWYYFNSKGVMLTGWQQIKDTNSGKTNWYYLNTDGHMQKGWLTYQGKKYHFSDKSGAMQTGWILIDDNYYYFDSNGVMQTGWIKYKNNYYYTDEKGVMLTGWQQIKYKNVISWFYFNKDGIMQTGWNDLEWNGSVRRYYFDNNGVMQTGWITYKNKKYHLNDGGQMQIGWILIDNKFYYFDKDGVMQTGWQNITWKDKLEWFYLDQDGVMQTGWKKLEWNGKTNWYYFDKNGVMQTGWQEIERNSAKNWYYFGNSGAMRTGWQQIEVNGVKNWYYFNKDGDMVSDTCKTIDGSDYCFAKSGKCTSGKGC